MEVLPTQPTMDGSQMIRMFAVILVISIVNHWAVTDSVIANEKLSQQSKLEDTQAMIGLLERFAQIVQAAESDTLQARSNPLRADARSVVDGLRDAHLEDVLSAYLVIAPDNNPVVQADWSDLHTQDRSVRDLFRCAVYVCNDWPDQNPGQGRWTHASTMRRHAASHFLELISVDSNHPSVSFETLDSNPKLWLSDIIKLRTDYQGYESQIIQRIKEDLLSSRPENGDDS